MSNIGPQPSGFKCIQCGAYRSNKLFCHPVLPNGDVEFRQLIIGFESEICDRCRSPRSNPADTTAQPAPIPNDRPAIADLVLADIRHRVEYGVRKYGTKLQAYNGRDALSDAYQEALDLVMYLRQEIEERDNK